MLTPPNPIETFIARWDGTAMAERANYQLFLSELCDLLGVPRPNPATGAGGDYRFERGVTHNDPDGRTTSRRIDLYKRDCFVCEAKQGATPHRHPGLFTLEAPTRQGEAQHRANVRNTPAWVRHMQRAKGQAEAYARDLPPAEGWPPFLIVCDVGFCLDLYADFSGTGKHYAQFPDREHFRIDLPDLRQTEVRDRLRAIWLNPNSLDPALRRAEVTRDIAALLAKLAAALEGPAAKPRHAPKHVATFLMRCIFCMFAQSVGLLPEPTSFSDLLRRCQGNTTAFVGLVGELWRAMDAGTFSAALATTVLRFNGGLFRPGPHGGADPLRVTEDELSLLILAAGKDWADVEPAIFGTLLESALDRKERGRLGAEFTPRPFVERLVLPAVMEPLRQDWDGVRAGAELAMQANDAKAAAALIRDFHANLCAIRVLDPACGTGNFLYVTLELMKRLEGEVLDTLAGYARGDAGLLDLAGATVDPHQFHGLDLNPRAVPVAELVLWIGYLQWHFRTNGAAPPAEPILRDFRTIREADALLSYTSTKADLDSAGRPITRWGGRTMPHPITGQDVPDLADQIPVERPIAPKQAPWPQADFIVGNPPFTGAKHLRENLGDGYTMALWAAYPKVPPSADLAMFFWWRAAAAVKDGRTRRFGFITSNSIRQVFCRRVIAAALEDRKHRPLPLPRRHPGPSRRDRRLGRGNRRPPQSPPRRTPPPHPDQPLQRPCRHPRPRPPHTSRARYPRRRPRRTPAPPPRLPRYRRAAAYGWPHDLPAQSIVERVVALNRERQAEEAAGLVRWLRPAYQAPIQPAQSAPKEQMAMTIDAADAALPTWPKAVGPQLVALRAALTRTGRASPTDLARQFRNVRPAKLTPMLEALTALGQARKTPEGQYMA